VTHLGNILREGDTVLGYDLASASWAKEEEAGKILKKKDLPDVVLVRKAYRTKGERAFELKTLDAQRDDSGGRGDKARDAGAMEEDYEEFLNQLEADKEMRGHVNLYRARNNKAKSRAAAAKDRKEERSARAEGGDGGGGGFSSSAGGRVGAAAGKMEMEADMRARGAAMQDDDGDDDDGDDGGDDDDERLRLDELLDELDLADPDGEGGGAGDGGGGEAGTVALDASEENLRILTAEEAARVAPLQVPSTGFDEADFVPPSQYKFT